MPLNEADMTLHRVIGIAAKTVPKSVSTDLGFPTSQLALCYTLLRGLRVGERSAEDVKSVKIAGILIRSFQQFDSASTERRAGCRKLCESGTAVPRYTAAVHDKGLNWMCTFGDVIVLQALPIGLPIT